MIKITSTNDVIIVEGDELTRHYPNNGTLVIPKNSTLVLLDETSEMVLFKSSANYDTLFTGILGSISIEDEIVTRDNIIDKFNAISNVNVGGNVDLFEVVQSLPTENISDNKVYLVLDSNGSEGNTYVEYLYVNGQWEELGKFKVNVDLSGYATEDWVNSQGFIKEHQDISNLATKSELATKQDVISDLDSIRSGAAKGATALQSVPSEYATEQWVNEQGFLKEHQDISNLATKSELATKQDKLVSGTNIKSINGTSLLSSGDIELATKEELNTKQDVISDLDTIRSGAAKGATALQSVPSEYATEQWVNEQGFLKEHQDISNLATKSELNEKQDTLVSGTNIKTINGTSLLGSGNIVIEASADNVPTLQTTKQGTTSNYVYSSGIDDSYGIISEIETSILYTSDRASIHTDWFYWGNTYHMADGADSWSIDGATNSQAGLMSASDKSKLDGIDLATKQDALVSGTNIKTINGTSLLGSGDITIDTNVDLTGYATEQWVNEQGFLKEHQDISNLATKSELATKQDVITDLDSIRSGAAKGATALQSVPSEYATEQWVNEQGFLKEHQDISNLATKDELNAKQDTINDLETIRSGAAKGATALQSVPDTYALKSEIPDITTKQDTLVSGTNIKTINGTSLLGSGNIEVAANVDLSGYATKEELNAKQDTLVSGTNIKTINGTSLLGSGNIEVAANVDLSSYATEEWVNSQGFLKEHQDISNLATKSELNAKQDVISDLDSIRSGAAKGATALQSVPDTYALKSEIKTVNGISLIGSGNIEVAKEWIGTQAQYDALSTKDNNTTYYITE